MWFSNVVFPDPKNPVIIVAGTRLSGGILVVTSSVSGSAAVDEAAAVNRRSLRFELGDLEMKEERERGVNEKL